LFDKLSQLWRRLLFYVQRNKFDRELEEEMRFHLEMKAEENFAAGISPEEARYAAWRQFGNQTLLREVSRDMWSFRSLEALAQDLRYGLRVMVKNPGFTTVAVLTLALGIGANTAIFTVINAVLLRDLPFREPERLVQFVRTNPNLPVGIQRLSPADFMALRQYQTSFSAVATYRIPPEGFTFLGGERPQQVYGAYVSADFFSLLGVPPLMGRTFQAGEDAANAEGAVVISHRFWQRHFGGDRQILGRALKLDSNKTLTIIGVMPEGFWFPRGDQSDFWINLRLQPPNRIGPFFYPGLGRLRPGVTPEQANAELSAIAARVREQFPGGPEDWTISARPLHDHLVAGAKTALWILMGAVALVLFIACVNVANLMLARAAGRQREMAVRLSLGATRPRLIRQLLTESMLLAGLGAAVGLLQARWGLSALLALLPDSLQLLRDARIEMDARVFAVTTLVALGSSLLFGLVPALLGSRAELARVMNEAGRSGTESGNHRRWRGLLVVSELALSLMLLVGAGLLIRSLLKLQSVDPGVQTKNVLTLFLPAGASYSKDDQIISFYDRLLERVRAIPGVQSAAISFGLPPNQRVIGQDFRVEGRPNDPRQQDPIADFLSVGDEYFETLGIPLRQGRAFDERDRPGAPNVVIINRRLADRFFPNEEPLGKQLRLGGAASRWILTIVGVAGDVNYRSLDTADEITLYVPHRQFAASDMSLIVRCSGDPMALAPAVQQQVWELNRDLAPTRIKTMEQLLSESVAQPRFRTVLLALFAGLALVLAGIGIYGVISYNVAQRRHELGIRMALGAQARDVLRLVVKQGMTLALIGVGAGLGGALALTRLLKTLLFGVSATDPPTFAVIAILLAAVALLACWIPARRATKVDPMTVLRSE
jgi:putative ABC transport system permease protein